MKLTKLPIPSRALDGIVSPRFPTRQLLPGRPFTNELLRERLHAITLPDSAATPPSFIPDKGKSGGSSPGRYANTARVRGRRNSKPVFRITFSLSSRQIRRPLSPLEGHLYSSFWRGRGREGEKMHGPLLGSRAFVIVHFERVHESLLTNGPPSQRVASSSSFG